MKRVEIIQENRNAALVEWHDDAGVHRGTLPSAALRQQDDGFYAQPEELEQAIPYGFPWEVLPLGNVGAEQVAQALRANGVWTTDDARARVATVRSALQAAYAKDLETLLNHLKAEQQRGG